MADPMRHVLQDETLRIGDLIALCLLFLALLWSLTWFTSYNLRPFGLCAAPRRRDTWSKHVARVSLTYFLIGSALTLIFIVHTRTAKQWSLSTALTWQECGNNPTYPRINETWSDACFWSSSQFRCTLPCCVPSISDYNQTDCICACIPTPQENLAHLSPMGWLFTFVFTYTGFALLMTGTIWNANLIQKIRQQLRRTVRRR